MVDMTSKQDSSNYISIHRSTTLHYLQDTSTYLLKITILASLTVINLSYLTTFKFKEN